MNILLVFNHVFTIDTVIIWSIHFNSCIETKTVARFRLSISSSFLPSFLKSLGRSPLNFTVQIPSFLLCFLLSSYFNIYLSSSFTSLPSPIELLFFYCMPIKKYKASFYPLFFGFVEFDLGY